MKRSTIVKNLINIFVKRRRQFFWESLFAFSLKHMNYGNGGNFEQSGELYIFKYVQNYFGKDLLLIIFDVGGNAGNYAKALSNFFKSNAIIHSFEPSKKTYEMFLETTKNIQNIISNNIGFSDKVNFQKLYTNEDGSGLASIYKRNLEHYKISMDKSEMIKLSTIDVYCKTNIINRIHLLKLDIERNELKALKGAKYMIVEKKIDFIQFEFGGSNIDSRTYFQDFFYLLKDNYRIFRILKNGLFELPTYKETNEIFTTVNYLAIKRE